MWSVRVWSKSETSKNWEKSAIKRPPWFKDSFNLSYHIDRVYQETNIDSAREKSSLYSIARNNGVKIPGPKGSMAEVRISAILEDIEREAPIIRRGTRFSSGSQEFELLSDVDFKEQFNDSGVSDRTIIPIVNTNGVRTGYNVSKLAIVTAGETKVYGRQSACKWIY